MNDLEFLRKVIDRLNHSQIKTWIFGGWGEELQGLIQPRKHHDIDLLYPAKDFTLLENFMSEYEDIEEIIGKRFPHKRAFFLEDIVIELFLVESDAEKHMTNLYGRYPYRWPDDTFDYVIECQQNLLNIGSVSALKAYRKDYELIARIRREYLSYLSWFLFA